MAPLIQASQSTEFCFSVPSYKLNPRTPILPALQFKIFGPQFLNVISFSLTPGDNSRHHIPSSKLGFPGNPLKYPFCTVYRNTCSPADPLLTCKCNPSTLFAVKFIRPLSGSTRMFELVKLTLPSVTRLCLNEWLIRILQLSNVTSLFFPKLVLMFGLLVPRPSGVVIKVSSLNNTF